MGKKPETPEEQWEAVVRSAHAAGEERPAEEDADADDAADARTDEEVDAALRAHGYDVEKIHRDGEAFVAKMMATLDAEEARVGPQEEPLQPDAEGSRLSVAKAPASSAEPAQAVFADNVTPLKPRTSRARPAWVTLLIAAALVVALAAAAAETVAILDRPKEAPIEPDRTPPLRTPAPREPTPEELVAALRRDATEACDRQDWRLCTQKLDDAARDDPAGERAPAVQALRQRVVEGLFKKEKGDLKASGSGGK
jgi:hypothetical protein